MELDKKFFQNYKELIYIVLILFFAVIFSLKFFISSVINLNNASNDKKGQIARVEEIKARFADVEKEKSVRLAEENKLKPFFEPQGVSNDSLASFGGMFEDMVDFVKMNNLMLRSVEYQMYPKEDPFFVNFPNDFNVCGIKFYIVGSYTQLLKFLDDILTYPYFLDITDISVKPYRKDDQYVLVNMTITLYSKKHP